MLLDNVLDLGTKLLDRLIPDPVQKAQAQLELMKLQQSGELATLTAQTDINKVEASSSSFFVSGWRPYIGWVCGLALTYQYLVRPFIIAFFPGYSFPGLDDNLWQLLLGMLGLGGLRSFEKMKGVAS
ncbi:Holin of 3TMs, for gene-transfer release [uncultured Caudovirales phage]|uniref:Holin of 3TMs, for gene-transfer release n=1 Tax=uncultured Caudovirales phage TaxID=2100421 RepID=A0A6J5LI06_9CAUD|nr:Holin of 3TMs, for gene-transfer release [uncultured Caudovirales phage]